MLDLVTFNSAKTATHTIIWLHGLGASGNDFKTLIPQFKLPTNLHVNFIFPNAPIIPITINKGIKMRAWYDMYDITNKHDINHQDINSSLQLLDQIIQLQITQGISDKNIMIAGFSQGGTIAALAGLKMRYKFAGIILLSTYLPDLYYTVKLNLFNNQLPFFIGHGTRDPIISIDLANTLYTNLKQQGIKIHFHKYEMGHNMCSLEIHNISQFIQCYCK